MKPCSHRREHVTHSQQSHILIDGNGVARLVAAGCSSIVAEPGTPFVDHVQSGLGGYIDSYRYSAPEIQWYDDDSPDEVLITKESDVFGMGMVTYEASSHCPASFDPKVEAHPYP